MSYVHNLNNKFLVKVEPEYDTYKDGTVESEVDKETGKCHDLTDDIRSEQSDKKDELDLEKCHGIAMCCINCYR